MDLELPNTRDRSSLISLMRSSPSVDANSHFKDIHERSLISLLRSSPSSSSSSPSSYYSWTPDDEEESPVRTGSDGSLCEPDQEHIAANANEPARGMGFRLFSFVGNGGSEWKDVEKRFTQIASWTGNGAEPVVKWTGFGYCIGENGNSGTCLHYSFVLSVCAVRNGTV